MHKLKLYSELAEIYDQLYLTLFDYENEAKFVDSILKKYQFNEMLELGCGTGHLTRLLVKMGYHLTAVDLYEEMLQIARKRLPEVNFIQQDIRTLKFDKKFDSLIMLGRTFAYMLTNEDVEKSIQSFNNTLNPHGIILFDYFNASHFIKHFKENEEFIHEATFGHRKIKRISKNTWNLTHGVTFNWIATYQIEENGKIMEINDASILRAFFPEEIEYFLQREGFRVIEFFDHKSAFAILAKKIGNN